MSGNTASAASGHGEHQSLWVETLNRWCTLQPAHKLADKLSIQGHYKLTDKAAYMQSMRNW